MIIAEKKDLDEIKKMIAPYKKVLVTGCETCVSICWAGGEKEVGDLVSQLENDPDCADITFIQSSVDRQCEAEMVEPLRSEAENADAILSLGCGAGAVVMADLFEETPVFPALNTTFLGVPTELGVWVEKCRCCGDCTLDTTGGICPVVGCGKGLLNGPCGGVRRGGMCELDPEKHCAWVQIFDRLKKQGRLNLMEEYQEPQNHRAVERPGIIRAPLIQKT